VQRPLDWEAQFALGVEGFTTACGIQRVEVPKRLWRGGDASNRSAWYARLGTGIC
jgi:hypothetical protein